MQITENPSNDDIIIGGVNYWQQWRWPKRARKNYKDTKNTKIFSTITF